MKKFTLLILSIAMFAMMTTTVFGQNYFFETFDTNPTLAASQAPGVWYVDRYEPEVFESVSFDGDNRLRLGLDASDGPGNRPSSYSSGFYDTQGRKLDLNNEEACYVEIDIYVDSDYSNYEMRGGLWLTIDDLNGGTNLNYPIFEYHNYSEYAGFRVWESGSGWTDISYPQSSLVLDTWYTLRIELRDNESRFYLNGSLVHQYSSQNNFIITNMILNAKNFGTSYDMYFDNLRTGSLEEIWVDDDWTNQSDVDTFDNTLIWQVNAFDVVQDGVNAAVDGGTVNVREGNYPENLTITKNGLIIKGIGIVNINGSGANGINLNANDITLENLNVTGYTNGLKVSNAASVENLTVTDCSFDGNQFGWYIANDNATASSHTFDGINVENTTFNNNSKKGLYIEKLSNASFNNITVDGSGTANVPWNNGIDINLKWSAYENISITNSSIINCGSFGTASHPEAPAAVAIKARDDAPSYSIPAASLDGVIFTGNTISGPENGLRFGEFGKTNDSPINITLKNNKFIGTFNNDALTFNINNAVLDATLNYWGSTPDFNTLISGPVQYCPWYTDAAMTTTQGCPPVKNLTQVKYYQNIQPAVDEANPGDVIEVGAGTYEEAVEIDLPLHIYGLPGAIMDGSNLGLVTGLRVKSGDVTFENMTVTNYGGNGIVVGYEAPTPGNLQNIKILNCTVSNIQPGSSHGFGIYVGYEGEGFGNNTISSHLDYTGLEIIGNDVSNTANAALVVQSITSSGAPLLVKDNNFHNAVASGIWIDGARNLVILNNKINNNANGIFVSSIGDGWYAVDGATGPKYIAVMNNDFTDNANDGMVIYAGWNAFFSISMNKFVGNGFGLKNYLSTEVNATNNWWGSCNGPSGEGPGSGDAVSTNVDFDPWVGKSDSYNSPALWLSQASLAGNSLDNIHEWSGINCASLSAETFQSPREPLYNGPGVQFDNSGYWTENDAMEVGYNAEVSTDIDDVNGLGQVSKSIYVVFSATTPHQGTQTIFEIGGQKSGASISIQNGFLVAGMWNPWERKFWLMTEQLDPNVNYLAHLEFVRDETDPNNRESEFRVGLNGDYSDWISFRGLIEDQSPSGVGAGVKGTALKNIYYAHDHINHFDGTIYEVLVINSPADGDPNANKYDFGPDLAINYGITPPINLDNGPPAEKQTWNLEVWENAPVAEGNVNIYPNPAVESATLELPLAENSNVKISLNTIDGRLIQTVHNGQLSQGMNVIDIDTQALQSGIYNLVINIDGNAINKQIVVVK